MACESSTNASEALELALTGPAKASGDGQSVEQHKLSDLIAADQYMAAKCASTSSRRGMRITKMIPEGTV